MSFSRRIRWSSASRVTSLPEYLPNRTRSPAWTSGYHQFTGFGHFPFADRDDLPSWGFSLAGSGMMIPPSVLSSSSIRFTNMLSLNGLIFI